MAKISQLPPAGPLVGNEPVPVVQDGETRGAVIGEVIASITEAAETARDIALTQGPYYPNVAAGEAVTANGQEFAVAPGDGSIHWYRRTVGGSVEIFQGASKALIDSKISIAALAAGLASIGTPVGDLNDWMQGWAGPVTKTCGPGGDFTTFMAALDWYDEFGGSDVVEILITSLNTPAGNGGSMSIPVGGRTVRNLHSSNLFITGPAFAEGKAVPRNSDMSGVEADDRAFLRSQYGASIRFDGPKDLTGGFGLAFPHGIGGVARILTENASRYGWDFGFNVSHGNAVGGARARFSDCAFDGNVWAVSAAGSDVAFVGTRNWFGYQQSGGPLVMFGGKLSTGTAEFHVYTPPLPAWVNSPKYGLACYGVHLMMNPDGFANKIDFFGQFLHGAYLVMGSWGEMLVPKFDRVTQPLTINGNIRINAFAISNANPANTNLTAGSVQPGIPGNEGSGALISVGPLGALAHHGGTIVNCIAAYYLLHQGGPSKGYPKIAVSGSKATTDAIRTYATIAAGWMEITTPQAGSVDQSQCLHGGVMFHYGNAGMSFSPALGTSSGGNANWS
ncbi:MAG: hypothetical protein LCH74_03630 [Proteobacteria bacterium]|nr:hypothetical protein [Pseudomonadota bacterium]